MMEQTKIAAVGEHGSVLVFRTAGVRTESAVTAEEAERAVTKLAADGYRVIFVSEVLLEQIPDIVNKYRPVPYPAIIPIPDRAGATGYSMKKITDNMEKAIGTNIFEK